MLATGIRTPVGIKILGPKLEALETIGTGAREAPEGHPGDAQRLCRAGDHGLFPRLRGAARGSGALRAERRRRPGRGPVGRRRDEPDHDRRGPRALPGQRALRAGAAHRHRQAQAHPGPGHALAGAAAGGGMARVRHGAAAAGSAQVPLGQLADIRIVKGPTAIKSEEGLLTAYVYIDFSGRDVGGYVEEAKRKAARPEASGRLPAGVERRVRVPREDPRAAEIRDPAHGAHHLRADLPQHPVGRRRPRSSSWRCRSPWSAPSGSSTCSATT